MGFELVEGFSRPNWKTIQAFVDKNVSSDDLPAAWDSLAQTWLQRLAQDLGGPARVCPSQNFLCLSDLDEPATQSLLSFGESALQTIRETLKTAAWSGYYGKHVLLLFSDLDDYFSYISYYFGEGSHILSGGVFLRDGYAHIVLPYTYPRGTEHALVHELVHNLLCHLAIPHWLNEGLATTIEKRLLRYRFSVDQDLVARHARHWNQQNIQSFWAGTSFDQPGETSELSYSLAEILVNLLSEKGRDFITFITQADWRDAGQDAALSCLRLDVGDLAASFLGPGNWRPQRKCISALLQPTVPPSTSSPLILTH